MKTTAAGSPACRGCPCWKIRFPLPFHHWLTCVQIHPEEARFDREELRLALLKAGVESRPLWKPMHLQPVFRSCPFYGAGVSDRLFEQGLCLPSGASLTGEDMDRIMDVMATL